MNKNSKYLGAAIALVIALGTGSRALATPVEITIEDYAKTGNFFTGDGADTSGSFALGLGKAHEDQEVERVSGLSAHAAQKWDLESMLISGNGQSLYLIGGYDFLNGLVDGRPGDLFIKVGGTQPGYLPTANTGNVTNALYNYTYAVDLSVSNYNGVNTYVNAASFGSSRSVYGLGTNTVLNSVQNDRFESNPWKYASGATSTTSTGVSYQTGLTSSAIQSTYGVTLLGSTHNVLTIDLSFLGQISPGTDVWLSYTMQCGNDSIKGHVPDGGTSAILIGIGLGAIALIKRKRRVA